MAERKYVLEKKVLGEGSFGTVYKGYEIKTGNEVAVKQFKINEGRFMRIKRDDNSRKSYLQESSNLASLAQHDNIVTMIAAYTISSKNFIVMELCDGMDLGRYMRQLQNVYGVQVEEFQAILLDVTAGYRHLVDHQMAHRDIKPDNIMRCTQRNGGVVFKLSDLGTAKIYNQELAADVQSDVGGMMSFVGTPMFMDPYLIARKHSQNKEVYSHLVDLWSLGITFYTLLCNCQPFDSRDDADFVEMISGKKETDIVGYTITRCGTDTAGVYGYSRL